MRICVYGMWHLGTVTAACLADIGHVVVGLDEDGNIIDELRAGNLPVSEPGLQEMVLKGVAAKSLSFTTEAADAIGGAEVLWVTYDTPVDNDDNADSEFVIDRVVEIFQFLPSDVLVVISSQLPVGSVHRLESMASSARPGCAIRFSCSPENLRLGRAIEVFRSPDRIIVGTRDGADREYFELLFKTITDRIEWMSTESAEMTKHAINAFLATSVTFANEVAEICERVGADAKEVERGLKSESRIGPRAYLAPGGAFAGGTLARDVAYLTGIASRNQIGSPLLSSIRQSNEEHKYWPVQVLQRRFTDLSNTTVAIWGLTYKPGTDTLRRSSAVEIGNWLLERKVKIRVHDPAVRDLPENWRDKALRFDSPLEAAVGADAIIVATEWPEYKNIDAVNLKRYAAGVLILDANRFLIHLQGASQIYYVAVGTPGSSGSLQ